MISVHSQADEHSPLQFNFSREAQGPCDSLDSFYLRNISSSPGLVTLRILLDGNEGHDGYH